MKSILREPLLHFLMLGALFFLIYLWVNPPAKSAAPNQIQVSQNDLDRMVQLFQKQWQRPPTQEELDGLVSAHLKEEVLYREALAMGLEKDDTIVRRRLAQKMEFLITDVTDPGSVEHKTLQAFYEKNSARYRRATKLTFRQIYFNPAKRGQRIEDEANATLKTLQTTHAGMNVPQDYGDRIMLQPRYNQISTDDIARDFGREFADKLATLTPGSWQGPIQSGFGLHLVYIQKRETASLLPLAEIREQVKNDYLYELRQTRSNELLDKLKARYQITIAPYPSAK
jgi:peptidyl-prolyl cis-trans isomerase C